MRCFSSPPPHASGAGFSEGKTHRPRASVPPAAVGTAHRSAQGFSGEPRGREPADTGVASRLFRSWKRRKPTFSRIRAVAWAPPSNRETRNDWLRTEAWLPLARARRSLPSVRPGRARLRHAHPPRGSITVTVSEEGHRSVRGSAEPPERRKRNAVKSEKDVVKMVEL